MMLETLPVNCNILLIASDPRTGKELERVFAHNLVVTTGKLLVAQFLTGEAGGAVGLTHCEVGEGNTAPALGDTALDTPHARKAITRFIRAANIAQARTFFPAADITIAIAEIGLFGGPDATITIGTGDLFNRALLSFDNTSGSRDLTLVAEITIS